MDAINQRLDDRRLLPRPLEIVVTQLRVTMATEFWWAKLWIKVNAAFPNLENFTLELEACLSGKCLHAIKWKIANVCDLVPAKKTTIAFVCDHSFFHPNYHHRTVSSSAVANYMNVFQTLISDPSSDCFYSQRLKGIRAAI